MKNLFLFLLLLFPMMLNAQTFNYSGTTVKYTDLNGDYQEGYVNKEGYVTFTDSTVVLFEAESDICHKPYLDTMKVVMSTQMAYEGVSYIISADTYFVHYPNKVLFIRKVGDIWLYETLKP